MTRFLAICWKEFLQLRRDRITVFMMAGLPVLQLLFFGSATNTAARNIPRVVFDQDGSEESRDVVRRLEATGFYDVVGHVRNYGEISRALRSGQARVATVVPASFGANIRGRLATEAQIVVDGSDPQTVASATHTAASMFGGLSMGLVLGRLSAAGLGRGGAVRRAARGAGRCTRPRG